MSILTYLVDAEIDSAKSEFDGKTLTPPTLKLSDGVNMTYVVDVDIGEKTPLRDVPIATSGRDMIYAQVGAPVRVRRAASGKFEVTGFSKRMPGTYNETPVAISPILFAPQTRFDGTIEEVPSATVVVGNPVPKGTTTRMLSYDEFAALGGYGLVPYGAYAKYVDGEFVGVFV